MVTDEGRAKVLDFNLAKLLAPPASMPEPTTLSRGSLSALGVMMGTAAYMSPEQAEGREGRRALRRLRLGIPPLRDGEGTVAVEASTSP